jgi:phage terminase Nu1 subunit (DNA packaging protein)
MKTPPSNRRESGTVTKLAKALGFTPRHTQTLLKQGMGDTLAEARQWLSERENSDSAAALRRERIGLVRAQRLAAEQANQRAAGELIARADAVADHVRIGSAVACFIRALERELPQLCLGLPLAQSAPLVKKRVRLLQSQLADMQSEFWKDHPTTTSDK